MIEYNVGEVLANEDKTGYNVRVVATAHQVGVLYFSTPPSGVEFDSILKEFKENLAEHLKTRVISGD